MDEVHSLCNSTAAKKSEWALWVMVSVYVIIFSFTVAILCLVIAAKTVPGTIRFVLANILTASVTHCLGIVSLNLRTIMLIIAPVFSHPPDISFELFFVITSIGASGRAAFMAVFAAVVVIIIKGSSSAVKFKYLVISVLGVWIACAAVASLLLVPGVLEVDPFGCNMIGSRMWIYVTLYVFFFAILPFTFTVVMPVYALYYIRANTLHENEVATLKPLLKFALFLLIGNMLVIMGHCVAVVGSLITRNNYSIKIEASLMLAHLYNVLVAVSLVPTPVLILVYFKPVRAQVRKCELKICKKWSKRRSGRLEQDPLRDLMLASP